MTVTATALTAITSTTSNDVPQPATSDARKSWGCHNCGLSFDSGEIQRAHMKSPWHVYNLRRRVASLTPIPQEVFETKLQAPVESPRPAPEQHPSAVIDNKTPSPYQCLFCHLTFGDGDADELDEVVAHMSLIHGLFIPDQDLLWDLGSFLRYLATQVRVWHECLCCGMTRRSTSAIQSHMRDVGHCRLNFEKELELCEFWERRGDGRKHHKSPSFNSADEVRKELKLQLPSRGQVGSTSIRRPSKPAARMTSACLTLPAGTESSQHHGPPRSQNFCQLARRDEMGLQNLGSQQRHALVVAMKMSQREEMTAKRAKEWTYARKANDQKHDQNYGALAWAKGGMHNLLPR